MRKSGLCSLLSCLPRSFSRSWATCLSKKLVISGWWVFPFFCFDSIFLCVKMMRHNGIFVYNLLITLVISQVFLWCQQQFFTHKGFPYLLCFEIIYDHFYFRYQVSRRFNEICASMLNSTFQRLQSQMLSRFQEIKTQMPRRESARR